MNPREVILAAAFERATGIPVEVTERHPLQMKSEYPKTPELDRTIAVKDESQIIGGFIEWLENESTHSICDKEDGEDWFPTHLTIEKLIAEYFKIDLSKCEEERRAVLEYLRS